MNTTTTTLTTQERQILNALDPEGKLGTEITTVKPRDLRRIRRVSRELRPGPYPAIRKHTPDLKYLSFEVLVLLGEKNPPAAWKAMPASDKARLRGLAAAYME